MQYHIIFFSYYLIYRKPKSANLNAWGKYVSEFAPETWFGVFASMVVSVIFYKAISSRIPSQEESSLSSSDVILFRIGSFCNMGEYL